MHMVLKMIDKLLRVGMDLWINLVTYLIELNAIGYWLPFKVAVRVVRRSAFLPFMRSAEHSIFN